MTTLDLDGSLVLPARARGSAPFVRVDVYADAAPVLDAWRELESVAPCSVYQTHGFIQSWVDTIGRRHAIEPRYVLARDGDRRPCALLCLGLKRHGPVRVASWLGGKDANFNMALLRHPARWEADDLRQLLFGAARACDPLAPDLFYLPNQPMRWGGTANPFVGLRHDRSPTPAFATALPPRAEDLFATKLSKDGRKKLRKKEARLASMGPIDYVVASDRDTQLRFIETFIAQKLERFPSRRIAAHVADPAMRAFLEAASRPGHGPVELHGLLVGERIVALYGGGAHRGRWSGMFNSFDGDETISRSSPGDLLLMRVMAHCCQAGLQEFDLGIGEARYKAAICDDRQSLIDVLLPTTTRGHVAALGFRLQARAKGRIKRHPRLLRLAHRLPPIFG